MLKSNFLTLIRANLTCGAEETLEVLNPTSSALNLSRFLRRAPSSSFLSSKALTFWFCILKECLITEKYKLFYYPKKVIELPNKDGIQAPPTGFTKSPQSKWKDSGSYLIFYNGITYQVPTSHKKMIGLKIFNEKLYKKYRKANKLNLKKEGDLKKLVYYFSSI